MKKTRLTESIYFFEILLMSMHLDPRISQVLYEWAEEINTNIDTLPHHLAQMNQRRAVGESTGLVVMGSKMYSITVSEVPNIATGTKYTKM